MDSVLFSSFEIPPTDIAFSKFDGYLRCLRRESLNELGVATLMYAFPGFLGNQEATPEFLQRMEELSKKVDHVYIEQQPRRFSGDVMNDDFPRGRYFSVARDSSGKDGFTLQRELLAYFEPEATGFIAAADLSHESELALLNIDGPTQDAIGALYLRHDKTYAMIVLPLTTTRVEIERCIDLRQPKTQQCFFEAFRAGAGKADETPTENEISSFHQMLPGLMWPERGGGLVEGHGGINRAIGRWMRKHDVSAFIFPSARVDVSVEVVDGEVRDWIGWNLVDYRQSGPSLSFGETAPVSLFTGSWPKSFPYPVRIARAPHDSPDAGSWKMTGNEEGQAIKMREKLQAAFKAIIEQQNRPLPDVLARFIGASPVGDGDNKAP